MSFLLCFSCEQINCKGELNLPDLDKSNQMICNGELNFQTVNGELAWSSGVQRRAAPLTPPSHNVSLTYVHFSYFFFLQKTKLFLMVTWSGLTPFNGQLDAWLRSKPAAGPPLSVVNTIIESWWSTFAFFSEWGDWLLWWWFWWIVVWWANHSFDLEHVGALERFDDFANTFVELVKHPGELTTVQVLRWETCTSERVHYCSVKWTYASVYPHWYQFLVSYLDVAVSLDCIFRGLYNVQCANVDITANVQCLIPSLAFNFSNGKCKTKLNNFH